MDLSIPVSACPPHRSPPSRGIRRAPVAVAIVLLLPLAIATIGQASAAGAARAVSPTGSDSAEGTEAAPWRTIQHALTSLGAGDTLVVHGGTYVEHVSASLHAGTATAPIVVKAAPGER